MPSSISYAEALQHLAHLGPELSPSAPGAQPRKFDLAHMRALLAALGNPQLAFRSILIAGTNGKGSTAATLASILAAAGLRTALYTSPHLVRVNERMQLASPITPTEYASADVPATLGPIELHPIPDDDFARHYFRVDDTAATLVAQQLLPHTPSFFERLTATAFLWFAERRAEIAVLEVGLGGRLDATNTVEPLLSILTDIALDHQDYLGNTLTEIAREKAGILRPNGTLITLPQHPEVNQTLGEIAATLPNLRAVSAANFIPPPIREAESASSPRHNAESRPSEPTNPLKSEILESRHSDRGEAEWRNPRISPQAPQILAPNHYHIDLDGTLLEIDSPLPGRHQQRNLALALAAVDELRNNHGYKIGNEVIETGIRNTRWPGRLETLPLDATHQLLLDVAHNPAGAWTLRAAIAQLPSTQPRTLLFSCLRDKDLAEMAQILFPLFDSSSSDPDRRRDHILLAPIENPRAAHVDDLLALAHRLDIPAHAAPHVLGALAQAREITPPGGLILATGSVYLVGELRAHLLTHPESPTP